MPTYDWSTYIPTLIGIGLLSVVISVLLVILLFFVYKKFFNNKTPDLNPFKDNLIPVISNESIERLTRAFDMMVVHLQEYQEQNLESIRMITELRMARKIQNLTMPELDGIYCKYFKVSAINFPASEICGDYYDIIQVHEDNMYVVMGDVSGHGMRSGLIMLIVQAIIRTMIQYGVKIQITEIMDRLNYLLYHKYKFQEENMTITLLLLHFERSKIVMCGQHERIFIYRKESNYIEEINTLDLGLMLGLHEELGTKNRDRVARLEHGDKVLLYTDGIVETKNAKGEEFGADRLREGFMRHRNKEPSRITELLMKEVFMWYAGSQLEDDASVMVIERL